MIGRELFSEFGHCVRLEVEPVSPENEGEFRCVALTIWRNRLDGPGESWWLSEREAQTLRHMLNDALCGDAFAALSDYEQADEEGVMVLVSRQALDEITALPSDSDGSGGAGETGTGSTEGDSAGLKGIAK